MAAAVRGVKSCHCNRGEIEIRHGPCAGVEKVQAGDTSANVRTHSVCTDDK